MTPLKIAIDRIEDMLKGDDGQAWKDAENALTGLKKALEVQNKRQELLGYILQHDKCNRLTPRIVDIAFRAFMSGRSGKNPDDGGPCDWFNDTEPMVTEGIQIIRKELFDTSE